MTFSKDGSVTISGNNKWINYIQSGSMNTPAYGSAVSMWEVIADNGPVLTFNTYNKYFHLFADPYDIPSVGGASSDDDINENGYGHEGDYEFDIMKYSGDTLYLTGKKYNLNMIMTRVASSVDDEIYMNEVVAMADSFFNSKVPHVYINLPNGVRWIVKNGATSILKMFREDADEISTAEYHNVIITHDGLSFMNPITLDGYTIQNFIRQADGSLLCRDDMQTTITADDLSNVFRIETFSWKADTAQVGGTYVDLLRDLKNELNDYGKRKLSTIQISYDNNLSTYAVAFGCIYQKKTFYPTFYVTVDRVSDNQIKFRYDGQANDAGNVYAQRCPAFLRFMDALNSGTYTLTTSSLLAPVDMKMSEGGNYLLWRL